MPLQSLPGLSDSLNPAIEHRFNKLVKFSILEMHLNSNDANKI